MHFVGHAHLILLLQGATFCMLVDYPKIMQLKNRALSSLMSHAHFY